MNVANDNGLTSPIGGIYVLSSCTVSFNTAERNRSTGIAVFPRGLVTHNIAKDNAMMGFQVYCPSDVTFNRSSGSPVPYLLIESGRTCRFLHNE